MTSEVINLASTSDDRDQARELLKPYIGSLVAVKFIPYKNLYAPIPGEYPDPGIIRMIPRDQQQEIDLSGEGAILRALFQSEARFELTSQRAYNQSRRLIGYAALLPNITYIEPLG